MGEQEFTSIGFKQVPIASPGEVTKIVSSPINKHLSPLSTDPQNKDQFPYKYMIFQRILIIIAIAIGLAFACSIVFHYMHSEHFDIVRYWLQNHIFLGSIIYILLFAMFITLCFPSTAFELLAGYIFGLVQGLIITTIGKFLGSSLSYVIGRYLCEARVNSYLVQTNSPIFHALQSLLRGKRRVLIVFLTRFSLLPIAIKNYGLSVLNVPFFLFASAGLITGLPFSVAWVYAGNAARHLTKAMLSSQADSNQYQNNSENVFGAHKTTELAFMIIGAISALLLVVFVGYYTRLHILKLAKEEAEVNKLQSRDSPGSKA